MHGISQHADLQARPRHVGQLDGAWPAKAAPHVGRVSQRSSDKNMVIQYGDSMKDIFIGE